MHRKSVQGEYSNTGKTFMLRGSTLATWETQHLLLATWEAQHLLLVFNMSYTEWEPLRGLSPPITCSRADCSWRFNLVEVIILCIRYNIALWVALLSSYLERALYKSLNEWMNMLKMYWCVTFVTFVTGNTRRINDINLKLTDIRSKGRDFTLVPYSVLSSILKASIWS